MTQHQAPWQVYSNDGQPLPGVSATREQFAYDSLLIMGAAHVWIWRRTSAGVQVLVQKRALSKASWPGYYDISVAGHIDAGETPVGAAIREAGEEIGLPLDPRQLYYSFSLRTPLNEREIDTVFLYQLCDEVTFSFSDGEVEAVEWVTLDEFIAWTQTPDKYQLVPQGAAYFSLLIDKLQSIIG